MSDFSGSAAKKQRLCCDEDGCQVVAGPLSTEQQSVPKIFKLDVDCFDEIFEYLSIKDLHSMGQTCTTMNRVAGEYFKRNHSAAEKFCHDDGVYTVYCDRDGVVNERTQTSGFNRFISKISHYYHDFKPLRYIKSHIDEFQSIDYIYLVCMNLSKNRIEHLQKLYSKIETLQLRNCSIDGDAYEMIFRLCLNLKRLFLQRAALGHSWLQRDYPKLEYLELIPIPTTFDSNNDILNAFFQRNPSLRTFSTSGSCIWDNQHTFLKLTAQIDTLEVKMLYEYDIDFFTALCQLLNKIHGRGCFKRLHFYVQEVSEPISMQLISLQALELLCVKKLTKCHHLPMLTNLKEFVVYNGSAADMEILANSFSNLQRLFMRNATYDHVSPFIRRSPKLTKLRIFPANQHDFDGGILKLRTWNKERELLVGARKITVYVEDSIFLKTKWATPNGDTNLNLVEMKRADSYEWDNHYSHVK